MQQINVPITQEIRDWLTAARTSHPKQALSDRQLGRAALEWARTRLPAEDLASLTAGAVVPAPPLPEPAPGAPQTSTPEAARFTHRSAVWASAALLAAVLWPIAAYWLLARPGREMAALQRQEQAAAAPILSQQEADIRAGKARVATLTKEVDSLKASFNAATGEIAALRGEVPAQIAALEKTIELREWERQRREHGFHDW